MGVFRAQFGGAMRVTGHVSGVSNERSSINGGGRCRDRACGYRAYRMMRSTETGVAPSAPSEEWGRMVMEYSKKGFSEMRVQASW